MEFSAWITIASVCAAGAMSPGPSLAVVVKNTVAGGRLQGAACGVGHGIGVGIYAFAAVAGLHAIVDSLAEAIATMGAIYLVYLGAKVLWALSRASSAGGGDSAEPSTTAPGGRQGFSEGFFVAFLNPKIAVFFLALLGSFVPAEAGLLARSGVAAVAMAIDAGWYVLVALLLAASGAAAKLASHGRLLDGVFGLLLVGLGAWLLIDAWL